MAGKDFSLSPADVDAIATALAGKLRTAVPAGPVTGYACPACGHVYNGQASDPCPNNNCVRHDDPTVVGLHPATGEPVKDAEALKAAQEAHAAAAA